MRSPSEDIQTFGRGLEIYNLVVIPNEVRKAQRDAGIKLHLTMVNGNNLSKHEIHIFVSLLRCILRPTRKKKLSR